ncbi:EGF family domain-containing protein [Toxoplasma gondii]|uniref:EGF family domain-containing protein n=1 Tax=Toxoplasma gondii TaxID=5811 RepID=A0A7J6K654_TOXGO|nr:EGF family domain-containing protein [Toxoplasma gondii]
MIEYGLDRESYVPALVIKGTAMATELVTVTGFVNASVNFEVTTGARLSGQEFFHVYPPGSGCEQLTEPGGSRTGQPAGTPVTDSSELPGSPEPEAGIFGIPGAPDVINALEPQIPGMPRTDIPIPEAKIQPPHANMPTVDIRSPLPNPPSYEATMPYIPVGMKVAVGALSILAGGATVSLMYAVNQKRK